MFTKEQLIEYFSDRYTSEQVFEALQIMKDNGADVDPLGDEFSFDITEELDRIFEAIGAAIDSQNKLPASEHSPALVIQEATQLAASYSSRINQQMMAAMIRTVTQGAISEANSLLQIRAKVIERVLSAGNQEIAECLHQESLESANYLRTLAGDDTRIDKLLAGYGLTTTTDIDIEAFLQEVKAGASQVKSDVKALACDIASIGPQNNCQVFDVDAFLLEVENANS
ncbi:hypothetical protein [Nostoc sp. MG11]|uniref:hypothetical protein n=1 Tax=Nostoc sp. MG11 TaxID=2721166 RepID=UPI001867EA3E|nr:hypothetical protein [Nostoc sp. MG11]